MKFTAEARDRLVDYLSRPGYRIPQGLGTEDAACSVAAINLAIDGKLTDEIPDCMSLVLGKWIVAVQDVMPDDIRNSDRWKNALPDAAGTGREQERERLDQILDWMWGSVLPAVHANADKLGFGPQWKKMCEDRSVQSARDARDAANAAARAARDAAYAADADAASDAAAYAADAYAYGAAAAGDAAYAAYAADAAYAYAAAYAAYTAYAAATNAAWREFNPAGLLERITA